jgi:DNA-binding LacI/PurR family transcriptional regulator
MVTIKDVAKASGVSPSTVSRVISNHPRISIKTKKKVKKAMEQLGYYPNMNARNLAAKSTRAIGVIMPSSADKALQNPFFPEILRGIGSVTHEMEFSITLSTGVNEEGVLQEVERMVYGRNVDGILLLYSKINDPVMKFLYENDFPFVIVGKPHEHLNEITHVDNDNIAAANQITKHLIELGHERIAFIGGFRNFFVTRDREEGYESAMQEANLPIPESYKIHTDFLKSSGHEAVDYLLSLKIKPTALVVSDDLISLGVLSRLEDFGMKVPEDISLVSFNNLYLSEITRPALTTVDINIYQLGVQSAKALIEKTLNKSEPAKRIIIPHKIVYRDSASSIK